MTPAFWSAAGLGVVVLALGIAGYLLAKGVSEI